MKTKQYKQCPNYKASREEVNPVFKHAFVVTYRNGEREVLGCRDCNGYNILCDYYKEFMEYGDSSCNHLQGGGFRVE